MDHVKKSQRVKKGTNNLYEKTLTDLNIRGFTLFYYPLGIFFTLQDFQLSPLSNTKFHLYFNIL